MGGSHSHVEDELRKQRDEAWKKVADIQSQMEDIKRRIDEKEADEARKAAEERLIAAEERLMRGIPPDLRPTSGQLLQFRELYGYGTHALNIAITGGSGVGKSALLNAVRGLRPADPGAAAVGVNETTAVVQGYVDPHHPHVKWFDVPGANTPNVSDWLYFMKQNLYIFDALVILFSDRFTQTVGTLLSNAQRCGIPTYLVRTKADQLIENLKEDHGGVTTDAAKRILVDETSKMVNKNLQLLNLPLKRVYIVSVKGMRQWVTERDGSKAIDEEEIHQMIFSGSRSDGKDMAAVVDESE